MRQILKFVLRPRLTTIETADEPRFLAVGAQGRDIVVWVEATIGEGVKTVLGAAMTGESPPDDGEYLGTATQADGIVVHVYRQVGP